MDDDDELGPEPVLDDSDDENPIASTAATAGPVSSNALAMLSSLQSIAKPQVSVVTDPVSPVISSVSPYPAPSALSAPPPPAVAPSASEASAPLRVPAYLASPRAPDTPITPTAAATAKGLL